MAATEMAIKTKTNGNLRIEFPVFNLTRDTSHLSRWQRLLFWKIFLPFARWCYAKGLPVIVAPDGTRLVLQSICTSEATANAICASLGELAFYKKGPVDVNLPPGEVVFGGNRFPYSDAAQMYRTNGDREIPVMCPWMGEPCRPHDALKKGGALDDVDKQADTLLREARSIARGT